MADDVALRRRRVGAMVAALVLVAAAVAFRAGAPAALAVFCGGVAGLLFVLDRRWHRSQQGQLVARARSAGSAIEALADRAERLRDKASNEIPAAEHRRSQAVQAAWLHATTIDELRRYGSNLPLGALRGAGIERVAQLQSTTTEQLCALHGIGPSSARGILTAAARCDQQVRRQPIPQPDPLNIRAEDAELLVLCAQRDVAQRDLTTFAPSLRKTANELNAQVDAAVGDVSFIAWLRQEFAAHRHDSLGCDQATLSELVDSLDGEEGRTARANASRFLEDTEREMAAIRTEHAVAAFRAGTLRLRAEPVPPAATRRSVRPSPIATPRQPGLGDRPARALGLVAAGLFLVFGALATGDAGEQADVAGTTTAIDSTEIQPFAASTTEVKRDAPTTTAAPVIAGAPSTTVAPSTTAAPTTTAAPATTAAPTTSSPPTTAVPTTTAAPATTAPPTTAAPTTTAAPVTTSPPTTAAAAAGGCHPSYTGACVPAGVSDVDCAGGSGDGPAYVSGPIRVAGSDPYGLDRDGDGIACEP